MSLGEVQKDFMAYLYTLRPPADLLRRVRTLFNSPDTPDPEKGLTVYRRNLVFGLIGALKETYPFCFALLGENNFNFFCREYIYANPSRNSDLMEYGAGFGDFLSNRPESMDWPFLPDIARLEWARDRVFYAAPGFGEKPSIRFSELEIQTPNALRLVITSYRIYKPWSRFIEGGLEAMDNDPFRRGEEYLVVWSDEGIPNVEPVEPSVGRFLELLEKGGSLRTDSGTDLHDGLENIFRRGWAQG